MKRPDQAGMFDSPKALHVASRVCRDLQPQHKIHVNAHFLALHVQISRIQYFGKIAGAVGNYNAHMSAYPDVAWDDVASRFVESLGLQWNPYVTQVCHSDLLPLRHTGAEWCSALQGQLTGHRL